MALARSFLKSLSRRLWLAIAVGLIGGGALAYATFGAGALAQSAPGGWTLCNQTSYIVEAATGRPEGKAVLVSGWMKLRPGQCRPAAAAPLTKGVYYLYGRTSTAHRGGRRQWTGAARLCVDPQNSFAIENPPSCQSMGLEERTFREVRINKKDGWQTNFAESEPYTLDSARSAGLQRLLNDAGYDSSTPSGGVDPRRMAASIARFRADSHLPPTANVDVLIDTLEASAHKRADAVGLTLCNRTAGRVWTAIARRRGEGWESRGWWSLGPGGCARTIDDPLLQGVYFVDAMLESPQGDRALAAGGESFCTSPSKFAIIGRESCTSRWYDTGLFTPISPQGRDGMVVDFFDRDFLLPGAQAKHVEIPKMADDSVTIATGGLKHGLVPNSAPAKGKPLQKPPAPIGQTAGGEE